MIKLENNVFSFMLSYLKFLILCALNLFIKKGDNYILVLKYILL